MSNLSLKDIFSTLAQRGRSLVDHERYSGNPQENLIRLCTDLLSVAGEASGVALAEQVLSVYHSLDRDQQSRFFLYLMEQGGPDYHALSSSISAYRQSGSQEDAIAVNRTSEPRRRELLRRVNLASGGTAALVRMRVDLMDQMEHDERLRIVDNDFQHMFTSWFNRGFLVSERIDWNTSAAVLEKIIRYEAVHEIQDWADLRRRIDPPDRRCYAFFHPALIDEPLIFVEVALTRSKISGIASVLSKKRHPIAASEANTAVFYSISNCQYGLKGISFGHFLIKQVVEDLKRSLPGLKTFITLSPAPKFMDWLRTASDEDLAIDSDAERDWFKAAIRTGNWVDNVLEQKRLQKLLLPLAAQYFLLEKRRHKPLDPVARFHLGNGASLEGINWMADVSENGLRQSAGIMVNYRYMLREIEKNHERYVNQHEIVASSQVSRLLKKR